MPKPEEIEVPTPSVEGAPSTPEQDVPSPEVKVEKPTEPVETPKVPEGGEKVSRLQEQVDNLNIALKQEREDGRVKTDEMSKKLEESTSFIDRFKSAIDPKVEETPEEPTFASKDDLDSLKESLKNELKEEQVHNQKLEEYKTQIKDLETEWDGKEGKPAYNDDEVLAWQRDNNKTYFSPKEAFAEMKRNELIDYEVKQRLAGKKPVENVEQPSTAPTTHEPGVPESNAALDTRSAVMEAMNNAEKEM